MKNFTVLSVFIGITFLTGIHSCRESEYTLPSEFNVISDNGGGTGTTTWKADEKYLLNGIVYVNEGQTLTIEPGAVIRPKQARKKTPAHW